MEVLLYFNYSVEYDDRHGIQLLMRNLDSNSDLDETIFQIITIN